MLNHHEKRKTTRESALESAQAAEEEVKRFTDLGDYEMARIWRSVALEWRKVARGCEKREAA
jgi:hypothetical protein